MSCYEQFGWGPDHIRQLPESEALLLSVYFEELAAFRAERERELSRPANQPGVITELEVPFEDDEEP